MTCLNNILRKRHVLARRCVVRYVLGLRYVIRRSVKRAARFTERLITYLSPKTYLTTHLRPKRVLSLSYC